MTTLSFKTILKLLIVSLSIVAFSSCEDDEDEVFIPKPKGYPRVDFPKKAYKLYDSLCPYSFEIPTYSSISNDKHKGADPCWINVNFPQYNAQIHLSYKVVTNNLDTFLNDSRDFAIKHQIKATGLDEKAITKLSTFSRTSSSTRLNKGIAIASCPLFGDITIWSFIKPS